ncbi:DUF3291 domain-containing protein [Patiriisocius marinus]|uniref:DUF3291 domain-containing protein n=1 Tax=Patiriisocius marinus TaxID=1397112 RepID=UPI00232D8A7F|nr:DUF3291 domain-containing protein [Patiriisocius marinus]
MQLAQLNLADAIADMESPIMAGFINATDRINELAAQSDGYIWSLIDRPEEERENRIEVFSKESVLVNMTVWKNRESLFEFVYSSDHKDIMIRKKEWFQKMPKIHMVLWYVPDGHQPTISEGKERLEYLRLHGETPYAFSFKSKFTPEDTK